MSWKPIQRGKPELLGRHPERKGLVEIEIELDPEPPDGWEQCFGNPDGVSISLSMHRPVLYGSTIYIKPPEREAR